MRNVIINLYKIMVAIAITSTGFTKLGVSVGENL